MDFPSAERGAEEAEPAEDCSQAIADDTTADAVDGVSDADLATCAAVRPHVDAHLHSSGSLPMSFNSRA